MPEQQTSDSEVRTETQRDRRARTLKGAHAAFHNECSAVPCTMRDESATGAKLQFDEGWWVPDQFTLFVDIDGYKVDCEKIWHKGKLYGVRFVGGKVETGTANRQIVTLSDMSSPLERHAVKATPSPEDEPRTSSKFQHRRAFGKLGQQH